MVDAHFYLKYKSDAKAGSPFAGRPRHVMQIGALLAESFFLVFTRHLKLLLIQHSIEAGVFGMYLALCFFIQLSLRMPASL